MAEREIAGEVRVERRRVTRSRRFLVRMVLFLVLIIALVAALFRPLAIAFMGNPAVNGVILGLLLAGIVYIFRQVMLLEPENEWIENFRERLANRDLTAPSGPAPRLLAPMAGMLGARQSGRVSLSATSLRTLLDGIASRLDETRETSRYLIGTLIFLGLLGTFYGLLETVRSVGDVIGGLNVTANDVARAFAALKSGLETPLHGMATAFSASLFGLSGSLVLGFLDLQAGQAQNRFYNDLEEWLSTYTRLSSGPFGDSGDGSVPAYIQALLEQTADSLDNLQRILGRNEESRMGANTTLATLAERLATLSEHMKAGQLLMVRLAENQMELKPSLTRLATVAEQSLGRDDVLSSHMRNIEAYMARLTEDMAEGRSQTVLELRGEIRLVARTIAALAEEGSR
ncbi:MAG TPA: flagellar motor protein MotA [Stellaceae bacterium]|nr:flagellar motor protein MotA [Stellaceae bacterium]